MASMFNLAAVKNSLDEVRAQVYPRNETERKVYEALSSKNWGASTSSLNELANDMFDYEKYKIISEIVWGNLNTEGKNWRQVFKTLTFIDFMIKNGSERFIEDCRDRLHRIRALQDYNFYEENIDRGSGVREKSKQVVELLNNNEAIRSEREKARALRNKFVGIDSRNASSGGYGNSNSYDNDRYSSGGRYDSYDPNPRRNNDSYAGNARRTSETSAGTTGRYGGGAYDSSRPSRYDDEPHFEEPKPTIAAPKPASSSAGSTSTGGKLKVSIKKVASAPPKAAEVDLMPTGGDVDLIGGFDSAPAHAAPTTSGASDFDPFGIASSSSAPNVGSVADFDPFGVSQSFSAPAAPAAPAPVHAFDPFAAPAPAPAPVPAPVMTQMAPPVANFAPNFPVYSQPMAPAPLATPAAPVPAPFGAYSNNTMPPMMSAPAFAPPAQAFAPQPSFQQVPAVMNTVTAQDNEFGDFEGAPQPAKPAKPAAPAENKWGDLAKLVDLSKIEKNETVAAKQAAVKPSSNFDSFAGLDGFSKAPSTMSSGSNRPIGSMMTSSQPAMMSRPMGTPQGYPANMNGAPGYGMGAAPMAMPPTPIGAAPYGGAPYGAPMNVQRNAPYPPANGMGMYNTGMAPSQGYMGAMPPQDPSMMGGMMPPQNYGMPNQQYRGGF